MPHTWIVWDMCKELHSHITIQEIGVVRCPIAFENCYILLEGLRKHFLICLQSEDCTTNIATIFHNSQKILNS